MHKTKPRQELIIDLLQDSKEAASNPLTPQHLAHIKNLFSNYAKELLDNRTILHHLKTADIPLPTINKIKQYLQLTDSLRPASKTQTPINTPTQIFERYRSMADYPTEVMRGIFMNVRNEIVSARNVSMGSYNFLMCTPGDVLYPALKLNARHLILVHNHPSGDCRPSEDDMLFTKKMAKAASLLGIAFLDHIIIGKGNYYSFKRSDLL